MFIDDYIEIISLKDENAKLKSDIDLYRKAGAEKTEKITRLSKELDVLKYTNLVLRTNAEDKIEALEAKIKMLENDRKEGLKSCCDCSNKFQDRVKGLKDEVCNLNEEKQQEADNLRNRVKDLEAEIDHLKSNPSTVSDSELLAIHTADVETINKLNIRARDLNGTISALLDRVSESDKENQELKKKVQELKDIIKDLSAKLYK